MLACLAMVSLTNYFLMGEFDHSTGLIKFNLLVCLFPNNAFTGNSNFFCFVGLVKNKKTTNILAIIFFEQTPCSSNLKSVHSPA